MPYINDIRAREILDSRGNPTVEVTVFTENFQGTASVPSGASKGEHEAQELRDFKSRYNGLGVQKAISTIHTKIAPLLRGMDCTRQREIDSLMVEKDGTVNKSNFGANAILAISLACARAGAKSEGKPLFQYLNLFPQCSKKAKLPTPFCNVINGGKHADNSLAIQEFMLVPQSKSFKENIRIVAEIYHTLKQQLHKEWVNGTNVADEGGFAPPYKHTTDALKALTKAINTAGYKNKCNIAIDAAASDFYSNKKYKLGGKTMTADQLTSYYLSLTKRFPIISIEDPFQQDDFTSFNTLKQKTNIQIVTDDLTVSNPQRVEKAIRNKAGNCLLLKVNQIGTVTEALDAAKLAMDAGWNVMVSHRSGETEDSFIADLAVALGCGMIKAGAPCRGERTAKYNQLLRIEEFLGK